MNLNEVHAESCPAYINPFSKCDCGARSQAMKRPWKAKEINMETQIVDDDGIMLACGYGQQHTRATSAYIVRCVNAHDELVDCLKAAMGWMITTEESKKVMARCKQTLAALEGGKS